MNKFKVSARVIFFFSSLFCTSILRAPMNFPHWSPRLQYFYVFIIRYYFPPFFSVFMEISRVWKFSLLGCLPATAAKEKKKDRKQNLSPAIIIFMLLCVLPSRFFILSGFVILIIGWKWCWMSMCWLHCLILLLFLSHFALVGCWCVGGTCFYYFFFCWSFFLFFAILLHIYGEQVVPSASVFVWSFGEKLCNFTFAMTIHNAEYKWSFRLFLVFWGIVLYVALIVSASCAGIGWIFIPLLFAIAVCRKFSQSFISGDEKEKRFCVFSINNARDNTHKHKQA